MADMIPSKTLALTEKLISLSSVTPDDKGCQQHLIDLLTPLVARSGRRFQFGRLCSR